MINALFQYFLVGHNGHCLVQVVARVWAKFVKFRRLEYRRLSLERLWILLEAIHCVEGFFGACGTARQSFD